ncbi:MAG: DUF2255 family protein [Bacteroidia bacterium]|nr:DUF2255 family protein [Bacteroidia bacterium]
MRFPESFYRYLKNNNLVEIIGGRDREKFLQIWMVEVDERVFARSWNKSERSWFTAIQESGIGKIKYGDQVIEITGMKLSGKAEIHKQIEERYLEKYNQKDNIYYSEGITQIDYRNYTMEFFFHSKQDRS